MTSNGLNTTAQPAGPKFGLNTYTYGSGQVRTAIDVNGQPWWVGKDILNSLGYAEASITNVAKMFAHVPAEWQGRYLIPTPSGNQEMLTLTEPGLFFFLARSDKPAALPMQKWVAGEVLPAIRKTGGYSVAIKPMAASEFLQAQAQLGQDRLQLSLDRSNLSSDLALIDNKQLHLIQDLDTQIKAVLQQQAAMAAQLDENHRRAMPSLYSQRNMRLDQGPKTITATAKLLGASVFWLGQFLLDNGVVEVDEYVLLRLTKPYQNCGLFICVPEVEDFDPKIPELLVTPLGRLWLFRNACAGFLDGYISHKALLERVCHTSAETSPILSPDNLQVP